MSYITCITYVTYIHIYYDQFASRRGRCAMRPGLDRSHLYYILYVWIPIIPLYIYIYMYHGIILYII